MMPAKTSDEEYLLDGNEIVEFKLIKTAADLLNDSISFRPEMCHQIFGEKELIYGYKGLKIKIYYSAAWLHIYCGIEYSVKLEDIEPADLLRKISNKYEVPIIENVEVFQQKLEEDKKFLPFGTLISTFNAEAMEGHIDEVSSYEVYICSNRVPGFREFHKRMETFLLWYIDAASFIEFDDPGWEFFIVYEKYKTNDNEVGYAFAGVITAYEYYAFPDKRRPRISQVLVLPPFQSKGICAKLLSVFYDHYSSNPKIADITVEVPSEEFQRVRDFVDCIRVLNSSYYSPDKVCEEKREEFIAEIQSTFMLYKKQARRVYEILRLKNLNNLDEEELKKFRIEVKRRLNQPYQREKKMVAKCAARMTEQELQENFIGDEERMAKLDTFFSDLLNQYTAVINRLQLNRPLL